MARKRNLISRCVRLATLKNLVAKWQNIESKFCELCICITQRVGSKWHNSWQENDEVLK